MSRELEAFSSIVEGIYLSAYQPDHWQATLGELAHFFDGSRACMVISDPVIGLRAVESLDDPNLTSDGSQAPFWRDPLVSAWATLEAGAMRQYRDLVDLDELRQRDLWRILLAPRDMDNGLICVLRANPRQRWSLNLSRGSGQGEFSPSEVATVGLLARHALRAGEIERALHPAKPPYLARFPHAYFVADARGKVLEMNAVSEALISQPGAGLRLIAGHIRASSQADSVRLGQLINDCCVAAPDDGAGAGGMMMIVPGGETTMASRLLVSVAPMPVARLLGLPLERGALVLVRNVLAGAESDFAELLASLFGLSPSHARLASTLAGGIALRDAAESLGLSYGTARRYIEDIFSKTHTRRQPELVALLKSIEQARASQRQG